MPAEEDTRNPPSTLIFCFSNLYEIFINLCHLWIHFDYYPNLFKIVVFWCKTEWLVIFRTVDFGASEAPLNAERDDKQLP